MNKHTKIIYRQCRKKDLIPCIRLIRTAFNHLRLKTGKEPARFWARRSPEFEHLYEEDKKTFWCAWSEKKLVGFAAALNRGRQWYLAHLFIDPHFQDMGIGREMLRRVWRDGPDVSHSLSTFAYNMQAVGLYSKFGMAPLCTLPVMELELKKLKRPDPTGLEVISKITRNDLAWIIKLEAKIRGYAHAPEWHFWKDFEGVKILLFKDKGKRVGYSMFYNWGMISPAGAISNAYLTRVVAETLRQVRTREKEMKICCPSHNLNLYGYLIGLGFRLLEMDLFMADEPYPDFQRYVPARLSMF